jgi:hypothetical protein
LLVLLALYWSRQVSIRAFPADMVEYLGLTVPGNTAFPTDIGAGIGFAFGAAGGADAVLDAGAGAGAEAGAEAGAADASEPHSALRKSFHFMPLSVLLAFASLYLALHSAIVRAFADVPCMTMAATTAAAQKIA